MTSGDDGQHDLMVKAAWLSYVAERTQSEIADSLGISRIKVARLIAEARELGLVKIEIDHVLSETAAIEEVLRRRYGLRFCAVTPPLAEMTATIGAEAMSLSNEALARRAVGLEAAAILRRQIVQDREQDRVFGLAWGRTISAMADAFRPLNAPRVQFVSLLGSLTRSASANPFDVVQKLASKTGGEAKYLPVPFIADSEKDRAVFMQQKLVQEVVRAALRAKSCFISVGEMDSGSFLARYGYLGEDDIAHLRSLGAVGDTMGMFFNADGQFIDSAICRRTLAIELSALKNSSIVLLSAGLHKLAATRSILKAGFISGLVMDGDSARQLARSESVL